MAFKQPPLPASHQATTNSQPITTNVLFQQQQPAKNIEHGDTFTKSTITVP
ncbi:hypothetical protein COLO4_37995 [Corchorus olitorius]|uniref:Uncharacterized protein n=1 Tax=Corchorus olitorius TaxID=93759 RepID=A0A1R3FXM6_9ROSI|nr:hypothetical protein COLO4_37995 [Corchorus olitorius]